MNTSRLQTYEFLRKNAWKKFWAKRILSETGFLLEISSATGNSLDAQIFAPGRTASSGILTVTALLQKLLCWPQKKRLLPLQKMLNPMKLPAQRTPTLI